ncbi:MAG: enoyl-CoA hydratase/isomerase family protein [Acidimicrobiales bacterium]|nr:enoyl-CoA hydratase/isomerase family protein [Acidimicrobiales bacterium]HRW37467.1 enoyl-CoA hydratase/isomerase family protein [Aquihabitans sp.]
MPRQVPGSEVLDALLAPVEPEWTGELVAVHGPLEAAPEQLDRAIERRATTPCVLVGAPGWPADHPATALLDAVATDHAELDAMVATFTATPTASTALALHLRTVEHLDVAPALVAESALYSALQAGPEHQAWREATPVRTPRQGDDGPRIRIERPGDELRITLTRAQVRNALDARMRDELLEALAIARADPSLHLVLRGEGEAFCSGGDLDEFGTRSDPASAHLLRLRRSLGAALHELAGRTTVHVHGACAGSGVELAAFAGRVVARPSATFLLPELRMGLVPGAGGTVSLPRRIGRHATMRLCLLGLPTDADEALAVGLVDQIGGMI